MTRPKTDRTKLTLRLPPEVHQGLEQAKSSNDRSLNAEIVARLRASLNAPRKL